MAPATAKTVLGQKRGPGRPPRQQPAPKKAKLTSPVRTLQTPASLSPSIRSPEPEKPVHRLPYKINEHAPLPTLPSHQDLNLSDSEYHSIAASAVLAASLDRSRLKWVGQGVFERYWVKPETGKNARPPPPNNPEVKWQKHQGPCRIRIEPHILEAELYVEQKPRPVPQVKAYIPPPISRPGLVQPYVPPQQQHSAAPFQQRVLTPVAYQTPRPPQPPPGGRQPNERGLQAPPPAQPPRSSTPQGQTDKKLPPDPVISMLAGRASSDPVLKALMKEVATGNATQDQLKIFQAQIDELTKLINDKKKVEEGGANGNGVQATAVLGDTVGTTLGSGPLTAPSVQPVKPVQSFQQPAVQNHLRPPLPAAPPPPPPSQYHAPVAPLPPSPQPVVLAFTSPGASEDRFLFPQYSILEPLSPQHLLASFICTRKGRESADPTGLDPEVEYWQPITLMVEVAYKREHFLDCIKRWVKPPDEVRAHMEDTIKRCTKAPIRSLALRLPFKGGALAESDDTGQDNASSVTISEDKSKSGQGTKYVRKSALKNSSASTPLAPTRQHSADAPITAPAKSTEAISVSTTVTTPTTGVISTDAAASSGPMAGEPPLPLRRGPGRPRRDAQKSVRISEG